MVIEREGRKFYVSDAATSLDENGVWQGISAASLIPYTLYERYGVTATFQMLVDEIAELQIKVDEDKAEIDRVATKFRSEADSDVKDALEAKLEKMADDSMPVLMEHSELKSIYKELTA